LVAAGVGEEAAGAAGAPIGAALQPLVQPVEQPVVQLDATGAPQAVHGAGALQVGAGAEQVLQDGAGAAQQRVRG